MGLSQRLVRLVKAYVRSWLKVPPPEDLSDDINWDEFLGKDYQEWKNSQSEHHQNRSRGPFSDVHPKLPQFYARLEIPFDSDLQIVRKAWKDLMRKYHPDRFGKDPEKLKTATKICQELTEAYLEIVQYLKAQGRA